MHIYAFGSLCRGEIDKYSDVDLLAIVKDVEQSNFDCNKFSIYSYERLQSLWIEGNPFAVHLMLESRLLYSSSGDDFIKSLGKTGRYLKVKEDCLRFFNLFRVAKENLSQQGHSSVFELSNIYLAIRNFATCFALGHLNINEFSRYSAYRIGKSSLEMESEKFLILQRARFLSTRGIGENLSDQEINSIYLELNKIETWMNLLNKILNHG